MSTPLPSPQKTQKLENDSSTKQIPADIVQWLPLLVKTFGTCS